MSDTGPGEYESSVSAARRWRLHLAGGSPASELADKLQVVFLCTGNRFRSPLATALFIKRATGLPVSVRSAGTLDLGSPPALPEALEHARRLGLDLSDHRARYLAHEDVHSVDLLLGFERAHIATAVVEGGAPREHAFTLPELVELLQEDNGQVEHEPPLGRARRAIQQAGAIRAASGRPEGNPELADPIGGSAAVFERTADEIDDLVTRLVRELFG